MKVYSKLTNPFRMKTDFTFNWNDEVDSILFKSHHENCDISDDDVYLANVIVEDKFNILKEDINEWINRNYGHFIIDCNSKFWNGYSSTCIYIYLENFDEILSKFGDADNIEVRYDKRSNTLIITLSYHDNKSTCELIPLTSFSRKELIDIVKGKEGSKEGNETARMYFGKSLSRLKKSELVEIISEIL